jgi:tetratricopeptide (TPR) repeat protein
MRRKLPELLLIGLGVAALAVTGVWATGSPGATAAPDDATVTATATLPTMGAGAQPLTGATPTPVGSAEEHLARARQLASTASGPEPIIAEVIAGVTLYLNQNILPDPSLTGHQEALDRLARLVHLRPDEPLPRLETADLDGDAQRDLLMFLDAAGGRALAFRRPGSSYHGYDVTATLADNPRRYIFDSETPRLELVGDINEDSRPELVMTFRLPAQDTSSVVLDIQAWDGEKFTSLLTRPVSDWGGPAGWELLPAKSASDLVVYYPLIGTFDFRLLPHQTITETWRWTASGYILASKEISPPETRHQQINAAEAAFQSGDYEQAINDYQKVINDPDLKSYRQWEGAPEPNWLAYAHLRLGECYALLGNEELAKEEIARARSFGGPLNQLAWAFAVGYTGEDAVVRAIGKLNQVDLQRLLYLVVPGNMLFPMEAFPIFYPGAAVAAYLDAHSEVVAHPSEGALDGLATFGLPLRGSYISDLDGDGRPEVVFLTQDDEAWHAWIAYRRQGGSRWRTGVAYTGAQLSLAGSLPLDGSRRQAVILRLAPNMAPDRILLSWDGEQVMCLEPGTNRVLGHGWAFPTPPPR